MSLDKKIDELFIVDGFSLEPVRLFSANFSFSLDFLKEFLSGKTHLKKFLKKSGFKFLGKDKNIDNSSYVSLLSALMSERSIVYSKNKKESNDYKKNDSELELLKKVKSVNFGKQILYSTQINKNDAGMPNFDFFTKKLTRYCVAYDQLPVFCYFTKSSSVKLSDVQLIFGYCALTERNRSQTNDVNNVKVNNAKNQRFLSEKDLDKNQYTDEDIFRIYVPSITHVEHAFDSCLSYFKENFISMGFDDYNIEKFSDDNTNYLYEVAIKRKINEFLDKI